MLQNPLALNVLAILMALMTIGVLALRLVLARQRLHRRLFGDARVERMVIEPSARSADELGLLERWLYLAGLRDPAAAPMFVVATVVCLIAAVAVVFMVRAAGSVELMASLLTALPGGVGEVLLPLAYASPWLALVTIGLLPTLMVRARWRRRVREVEQDLPMLLDLLATLAEAGLGLDSAIDRVLTALPTERTLAQELRAFQRDTQSGRQRVSALRLMARRISVPWFSMFCSAVVQAEQVGAGLAEVLKVQAEDLRQRRKEQALAVAMATPVKLLLPMIVCFMPGIFVASLGPVFYEIFQFLDNFAAGGS